MCDCAKRRQMIKRAAKGQVPVSKAASYVTKTLVKDTASQVNRMLNSRSGRRAA